MSGNFSIDTVMHIVAGCQGIATAHVARVGVSAILFLPNES